MLMKSIFVATFLISVLCDCCLGFCWEESNCIAPKADQVCNNHGKCNCGKCSCEPTYSGRFCENCPNCPGRCEEVTDCVQCQVHQTGKFEDNNCDVECLNSPSPEVVDVAKKDEGDERLCTHTDDTDGCQFYFVYGYDRKGQLNIKAQGHKDCPAEPPIFWIGSTISIALGVFLGCCLKRLF